MNRRQVLFGASASAIAVSGFVPWNMAYAADSTLAANSFTVFSMGTRGAVTLNGTLILSGTMRGGASQSVALPAKTASIASAEPVASGKATAPAATVATPSSAATAIRQPMMSIVAVPRGNARRDVATTH